LIEITARDMINLFGKTNYRIYGFLNEMPDPTKVFDYDGKKWLINSMRFEDSNQQWEVDLFNLD
jgi:beta-xylosidase